jgi:polyisoprenoid-binding protein YceI
VEPTPTEAEPETPPESEAAPEDEAAGPRTFVVVPEESEVSYEVDEEFFSGALDSLGIVAGLTKTIGKTSDINGSLTIDFSASPPQLVSGEFAVDISTLSSDQSRRDNQIRQRYLESSRFPIASFVASQIQNAPDSYADGQPVTFQLAGDLTVREITQPVVFDVEATLQEDTISGEATTLIKMSDFGVTPPEFANVFTVADDTVIRIMLNAVEQAQ